MQCLEFSRIVRSSHSLIQKQPFCHEPFEKQSSKKSQAESRHLRYSRHNYSFKRDIGIHFSLQQKNQPSKNIHWKVSKCFENKKDNNSDAMIAKDIRNLSKMKNRDWLSIEKNTVNGWKNYNYSYGFFSLTFTLLNL